MHELHPRDPQPSPLDAEGPREKLTPLQRAALGSLRGSSVPLSARELAHRLSRRQGRIVAPESIYRVLRALGRLGLIQRIESERKFVCADVAVPQHRRMSLVCKVCGRVQLRSVDVDAAGLMDELTRLAFVPERCVFELRGRCARCAIPESEECDS